MSTHLAKYADSIKFRQVGKRWKRGGTVGCWGVAMAKDQRRISRGYEGGVVLGNEMSRRWMILTVLTLYTWVISGC